MNITSYIQKNILGDASAVVTRKIDEHLEVVAKEIYDLHDWSWLKRSDTLTLTAGLTEYDLEGDDHDLAKVLKGFYGDDYEELNDKYDEIGFYKEIYGQVSTSEPGYLVPIRKIEFGWKVIIYPCDVSATLETVLYYYKKTFNVADNILYPNPMVFVDGIMWKYLTGVAVNVQDVTQANKITQLARDYGTSYIAGRELMKQNDSPLVYPKAHIAVSDTRRAVLDSLRTLRGMRTR